MLATMRGLKGYLSLFFRIVARSVRLFFEYDCFNRGAGISFFAIFSLIPILFIITALLGFVLGTKAGLFEEVVRLAREGVPYLSDRMIEDLRGLVQNWKTLGWLGVFFLLWSAELVLSALSSSLYVIFDVGSRYGFFLKRLKGMMVILIAITGVLISIGITALVELIRGMEVGRLGYYLERSLTFKYFLPFLIVVLSVGLVYRTVAGRMLPFWCAFVGSFVFTLLWEVAKHLFAWYIGNFPGYNRFYGSLGALLILLLWIFYSVCIFLFGAVFARASMEVSGREEI